MYSPSHMAGEDSYYCPNEPMWCDMQEMPQCCSESTSLVPANSVCNQVEPRACTESRPWYQALPFVAPIDQLLRSLVLLFVLIAWMFTSDFFLLLAFCTLCLNMCLCCGKPAVGCWLADVVIAIGLLLALLVRDTKYVVHLIFHGHSNHPILELGPSADGG